MQDDSSRILRTAALIWLGFLLAMLLMDVALYTPRFQNMLAISERIQNLQQNQQPLFPQQAQARNPLLPILLFYTANGITAVLFLIFTYWNWAKENLGKLFYPMMILVIAAAPIFINVLMVPRFPQGPLSNAEGMALRQLPVLFVALALVAWEYQLIHVIFFSLATAAFELGLILFNPFGFRNIFVFIFISIVRTISFIAVGIFINALVTRSRLQQQSLREANANLTHYASTLEQLAVSRERNRLARELHDTVAHSLTALSVSLETAKAYFDVDLNQTRELVDKSIEATRKGVDETRRALKSLRSSDLEDLGLRLAIKKIAESAASRFSLDLDLTLDPMPSLSPDVEQAIYRIAQEAIENITKHSEAKKIKVELVHNKQVSLTIQDNGTGFDMKSKAPTGHFGLIGMKERAELAGGTLNIESEKNKGTKVMLTI
ncbi:MAG: sensor histidine kinase [Anaerolineales bacterium]|nr:sensor histidine kinase [Anaerolineales bacterium]